MAGRGSGLKKKCNVSEELGDFLGVDSISRQELMKKVWAYIKKNDLQDEDNRRVIIPDASLAEILGDKPIDMFKMVKKLNEHLS
jgi:upstream activation factor subunit UAF30